MGEDCERSDVHEKDLCMNLNLIECSGPNLSRRSQVNKYILVPI